MSRRPAKPEAERPLRADAQRNRARLLEVARELFETEGTGAEMDEIARRAGIGVGTIYRHFPTKDALIRAVSDGLVERLVDAAHARSEAADASAAFFEYLGIFARELATKQSLGHAMAMSADASAVLVERRELFRDALGVLLKRAQKAKGVRADVTVDEVILLVRAPLWSGGPVDAAARKRLLDVVCAGLRA